MENIIAAESDERTCGTCSHYNFVVAYNGQYVGWCKVRNQHLAMKNSKENGCFDYKKRNIKQHYNSSDRSTPHTETVRF